MSFGLALLGIAVRFGVPWLVLGPTVVPEADVLFQFAMDTRLNSNAYAAELYRAGRVRKIVCASALIACDFNPADDARKEIIALGIPAEDVLVLHLPDTQCRAQLFPPTMDMVKAHGWRRVVWLVHPSGSGMMSRLMVPKYAAAGVTLTVAHNPAHGAEVINGWWRTHWKMQEVVRTPLETVTDWFFPDCW